MNYFLPKLRYIFFIIIFFFLDSSILGIYSLNPQFKNIHLLITQFLSVVFIFYFILKARDIKNSNIFWIIALFLISLILSSIINRTSLQRSISYLYRTLGLSAFIIISSRKEDIFKQFISAISFLFLLLNIINLIGIISTNSSGMFYENMSYYFLGGENQVGYPLIHGMLYNLLNYYYNNKKKQLFLYIALQGISLFMIFSGTNVTGFCIVMILLLIPSLKKIVSHFKVSFIYLLFVLLVVIIITFTVSSILELNIISYVIENGLDKTTTLSGRTEVWEEVSKKIFEKPIFGHGCAESGEVFQVITHTHGHRAIGMASAHNQIMQTLYEGGAVALLTLFFPFFYLDYKGNRHKSELNTIFKIIIIAILLMYMGEAPNIILLLSTLTLYNVCLQYQIPVRGTN